MQPTFSEYLDVNAAGFLQRCTACGECFRACPVVPLTSLAGADGRAVTGQVLALLRDDEGGMGRVFAEACTKCGQCLDVCPEGVNPRRMLTIAKYRTLPEQSGGFMAQMNRGIHILSGLQLSPDEMRMLVRGQSREVESADVVFHASCNLLRTPHIIFNVMGVLEAIGSDFVALGGSKFCCGSPQLELRDGGRDPSVLTKSSLKKFEAFGPRRVLSWCPSCLIIFQESLDGIVPSSSHIVHEHVVDYLADQSDRWTPLARTLDKRVVLHAHPSAQPRTADSARKVLESIPGVTVVDLPEGQGYFDWLYVCAPLEHLGRYPEIGVTTRERYFRDISELGVDALVTLYHACHRYLIDGELEHDFRVVNISDILVEALGLEAREDRFKRFKLYGDVKAVLEDAQQNIELNQMNPEVVEEQLPGLLSS